MTRRNGYELIPGDQWLFVGHVLATSPRNNATPSGQCQWRQ